MKEKLLEYIRCPVDLTQLDLHVFLNSNNEVAEGVLICPEGHWYPIVEYVPRLIIPELRLGDIYHKWYARNYNSLIKLDIDSNVDRQAENNGLTNIKKEISKSFGFGWSEFERFGWDDDKYNSNQTKIAFCTKTYLQPEDLNGKLTLDAGCGNGRYIYWAAQYGAEVIGIELFDAVDVAFRNTRNLSNVHIVQADVFLLPFTKSLFEVIYSIGVLQHTGDSPGAFASIADKTKKGGTVSIAVYSKGNMVYEYVVRSMRNRTTQMTTSELVAYVKHIHMLAGFLKRVKLYRIVKRFMYIEDHPHLLFNRFSAPIATHHTYDEVENWYQSKGFHIINSSKNAKEFLNNKLLKSAPVVAVRGIKTK